MAVDGSQNGYTLTKSEAKRASPIFELPMIAYVKSGREFDVRQILPLLLLILGFGNASRALANPDLRIDVVTFCCDCTNSGSQLCQPQFDHLNFPSANGHFLAMGSDAHRSDLQSNGNVLAVYYNNFDSDWSTNITAAQEAAAIDQNSVTQFTSTGPKPNWVILNEISSGVWPTNQTYRSWVTGVAGMLHTNYGYTVVVFSPFANPANNNADWQSLATNAYVAVENYLSGQEILAQNFSVSWCQGIYQSSITSYNALGVPTSRLILGEHFAQSLANSGYGRSGVSSNDWDHAINARSQAALNCGYAGFIGYAWDKDDMGVSTNEMMHYEDTYAANPLPAVEPLSAPYLLLQPQSQIAPPGATVNFTAIPAGDTPVTYQWKFNENDISGGTGSLLTLTKIGPLNMAGTNTVVVSNTVGPTLSSNAVLMVQTPAPLAYDPFADATGSGGTSYSTGASLIGQTNSQSLVWFQAGPNSGLTNQPFVQAGSLNVPGLAYSAGNSVAFGGGGGMCARLQIFTNSASLSSGTVYYSFALKLTNIAGLNASGIFWTGFNNSGGAQTSTPMVIATRLYIRAAGGGFNLGVSKSSSTSTDWQWDSAVHHLNEIIFIVGSYTFNTNSASDDVANLWINPAISSFGTGQAPAPTLTASSGADISSSVIHSFLIMNRDPSEPAGGLMDEVRVGTSWASVTPSSGPPPALNISLVGNSVVLSWSTNAPGFSLRSTPVLGSNSVWTIVPLPVNVVNGQNTVTNTLSGAAAYFRLQEP